MTWSAALKTLICGSGIRVTPAATYGASAGPPARIRTVLAVVPPIQKPSVSDPLAGTCCLQEILMSRGVEAV